MLRLPTREECVVWLHRILRLIFGFWQYFSMSLQRSRSETFKWIRKRFTLTQRSSSSNAQPTCQWADTNTENATATGPPAALGTSLAGTGGGGGLDIESAELAAAMSSLSLSSSLGDLSEVLVLNDTQIVARLTSSSDMQQLTTNEGSSAASTPASAPIACNEVDDAVLEQPAITTTVTTTNETLQRSKSRVRTYFQKCKQRLKGQQSSKTAAAAAVTVTTTAAATPTSSCQNSQQLAMLAEIEEVNAEDDNSSDAPSSYAESLPFALTEMPTPETTTSCHQRLATIDAQQAVYEQQPPQEATLGNATCMTLTTMTTMPTTAATTAMATTTCTDLDAMLANLIDRHLSHIYPIYWARTRAILIRQARDVLVCSFHGCLPAFEQHFLCKFAEIAATLRAAHQIGESWLWHAGWPLATQNGALVVQLSEAEPANALQASELYLCIKLASSEADNKQTPQLYAVWRATQSVDSVQSYCIDYQNTKALPLSLLQLEEMYSSSSNSNSNGAAQPTAAAVAAANTLPDGIELPQLLQNLLVSVERSIERVSLNELQMPIAQQLQQQQYEELDDTANNNGSGSPKCGLRRSDLITKNKLFNNRYMLRRLTNRQDSMNSTSSGNSCNSNSSSNSSSGNSSSSSASEELLKGNNNKRSLSNNNETSTAGNCSEKSTSPALPLFCLGNSFPHIDSDEEAAEASDKHLGLEACNASANTTTATATAAAEQPLLPPSSISELPEKLLISGVYLPGTRTVNGDPLVSVDADCVMAAGLNCYELATVFLYYSTIPERSNPATTLAMATAHKSSNANTATSQQQQQQQQQQQPAQQTFTILIAIEKSQHLCVIDLICQSLKLLSKQIGYCEILAVCLERNLLQLCNEQQQQQQQNNDHNGNSSSNNNLEPPSHLVKFISVDEVTTSVAPSQLPSSIGGGSGSRLRGLHHHDARKWREFFTQLELFQRQCSTAGQRLVSALSDIRAADLQGLPTRRQLYGQHRALSRALMDSELHNLRKRGAVMLARLQEMARAINKTTTTTATATATTPTTTAAAAAAAATITTTANNSSNYSFNSMPSAAVTSPSGNVDTAMRLRKVTLLFNEVDRAAQRLEQLTEQRRERLRELTRQRALEDEINEVTSWMSNEGADSLQKFTQLQWENEAQFKAQEQEFENYYFISMKHLAKGRDLHAAAHQMPVLCSSADNLKRTLDNFGEQLEKTHERIESAARLLHLLTQHTRDEAIYEEMQRLAEQLGAGALLDKYRVHRRAMRKSASLPMASSTPAVNAKQLQRTSYRSSSGNSSFEGGGQTCNCWRESRNLEDMDELLAASAVEEEDAEEEEEEQSKIADSGVGVCDRCEGNPKLARVCSCQSLNEAGNVYDKSHNCDELDDECFDRPTKRYMDMHSPMEANAHLQCHASSLELPKLEELSCLEPKIQKTLLLIMREMIGTERDYVRSLYYVIENYIDELLRDDIPQPLRGQRNVIFGNIEKIFEFHNSHFLRELERYEHNPLKVGAAFLEMESKFYLYALYNKNKPKSDTLLSEYGSSFFKPKQLELQDKMDLASYLLKPVQRMGKYALLLQQLVKACNSVEGAALQEIAADVEELHRAEEMVKFQLRHGNDLLAMDSLRDCDVNVKEQGRLLRQNEFLVWQGRGGKKTLRQVFLFEELVLFSKARRFPDHKNLDIYIYKNSIKTSDIGLTAHTGDSPNKFEIWFRKRKPDDTWMLQCMSEDIKNAWTEEISKLLWKQAKRNREVRLAEMSSMGIGSKPCLDIRPSNNQINDRSIPLTQLNKTPKLRHAEPGKGSMRRPNSLISESSLSSGTSSSSISTSSGGGHEGGRHSLHFGKSHSSGGSSNGGNCSNSATLELIKETQTLKLNSSHNSNHSDASSNPSSHSSSNNNHSSTTNPAKTGQAQGRGHAHGNSRHHKRSTTIVSQLSMESGIASDISLTPEQEQGMEHASSKGSVTSWSASTTTSTASASTVILRRYKSYAHAAESAAPDVGK